MEVFYFDLLLLDRWRLPCIGQGWQTIGTRQGCGFYTRAYDALSMQQSGATSCIHMA